MQMENEDFGSWGYDTSGGVATYNVGRVTGSGMEIVQLYPPLTMCDAAEIQKDMNLIFKTDTYVVFNVATILEGMKK